VGRHTKSKEAVQKLIRKGMEVCRLNMNYFETHEQAEITQNIKQAAKEEKVHCAIMVDLKGPLIRTLGFKEGYSIKVKTGEEVRISSN